MSRRHLLDVDLRDPLTVGQLHERVTQKLLEVGLTRGTDIVLVPEISDGVTSITVKVYAIEKR